MSLNLNTMLLNGAITIVAGIITIVIMGGMVYKIRKEMQEGEWGAKEYKNLIVACLVAIVVMAIGVSFLTNNNKKNLEIAKKIEVYGFEHIGRSAEGLYNVLSQEGENIDINERVKLKIGKDIYKGKIRKIFTNTKDATISIGGVVYKYEFEDIKELDKLIVNKDIEEILKDKQ